MRVNLLKRLESSVHAFRTTLAKLRRNHEATLERIETYRRTGRDGECDDLGGNLAGAEEDEDLFQALDDEGSQAGLIGGKVRLWLADMDLTSWERDLRADLAVLDDLHAEMARITPEHDAKLQDLRTQINSKLASPINPGNRKVLLFTGQRTTALLDDIQGPDDFELINFLVVLAADSDTAGQTA